MNMRHKMSDKPFIMDAHLDLSMNAMEWNRDLRWPIDKIRTSEQDMTDKPDRGRGTVSFRALREGNIGLVVRSEEHTSELQSRFDLVCRLLLEKKKQTL